MGSAELWHDLDFGLRIAQLLARFLGLCENVNFNKVSSVFF